MSSSEVRVDVKLLNVAGALVGNSNRDDVEPTFDVNVKPVSYTHLTLPTKA